MPNQPAAVMKVLVVDDHPVVRLGVMRLIEQAWPDAHITEAETVAAAKNCIAQQMPDADDTGALTQLQRVAKGAPILVLSQSNEATHAQRASQIALLMHLSVKTVANDRARILGKTGWRNNIELTKSCLQHGLATAV
jgi:DNA-binding NarL/FixJ family response regulator